MIRKRTEWTSNAFIIEDRVLFISDENQLIMTLGDDTLLFYALVGIHVISFLTNRIVKTIIKCNNKMLLRMFYYAISFQVYITFFNC